MKMPDNISPEIAAYIKALQTEKQHISRRYRQKTASSHGFLYHGSFSFLYYAGGLRGYEAFNS